MKRILAIIVILLLPAICGAATFDGSATSESRSFGGNLTSTSLYECGGVTAATLYGSPVTYNGTEYTNNPLAGGEGCEIGYIVMQIDGQDPVGATCDNQSMSLTDAFTADGALFDSGEDIYVGAANLGELGYVTFFYTDTVYTAIVLPMIGGTLDAQEVAFSWNESTCSYDTETLSTVAWYTDTCSTDDGDCSSTTFYETPIVVVEVGAGIHSFDYNATTKSLIIENDITTGDDLNVGDDANIAGDLVMNAGGVGIGTSPETTTGLNQAGIVVHKTYTDYSESEYVGPGGGSENYVRSGIRFQVYASPDEAWDGSGNYQITYGLQNLVITSTPNNMSQIYGGLNQAYVSGDGQTVDTVVGLDSKIGTLHANSAINQGYLFNASVAFAVGTHGKIVGLNIEDLTTNASEAWGIKSLTDMIALDDVEWVFGTDGDIRIGSDNDAGELTIADGVGEQDIKIFFDGTTNDGSITYMEDEDRFDFGEPITTSGYVGFGVLEDAPGTTNGMVWVESDGVHAYYGDSEYTLGTGTGGVEDAAFGSGWDSDTTNAPSRNAIYDILHAYDTDDDGDIDTVDSAAAADTGCTVVTTLTDDAINSAITALTSGGCVQLIEGTYEVDSGITLNQSRITIQGAGRGSILKISDGANGSLLNVISNWYIDNESSDYDVDDVILRDFAINGNYSNQASGTHDGIDLAGPENIFIDNVYIYDLRNRPVDIQDDFSAAQDPHHVVITNCEFDQGHNADYGIMIDNANDVFVDKNIVRNTNNYGIYVYPTATGDNGRVIISNNILTDVDGGIYLRGSSGEEDRLIVNNVIWADNTATSNYGINTESASVIGNKVYYTYDNGLYIGGNFVIARDNLFLECGNTDPAVYINADYAQVTDNVIVDNSGTYAINISSGADYCVVANNYVSGSSDTIRNYAGATDNFVSFYSDNNNYWKIGGGGDDSDVSAPDRFVHIEEYLNVTNTVSYPLRIGMSTYDASPAAGIGVGMDFEAETGDEHFEVLGSMELTTTDVTTDSEDAEWTFQVITAGSLAERLALNADGFAFNGATPIARPDYTVTNVSEDRAFDADSTTDAEIADILGQLITDLISYGILQ